MPASSARVTQGSADSTPIARKRSKLPKVNGPVLSVAGAANLWGGLLTVGVLRKPRLYAGHGRSFQQPSDSPDRGTRKDRITVGRFALRDYGD
jgi:hypothetical protein